MWKRLAKPGQRLFGVATESAFEGIVDERPTVERITDIIGDLIDDIVEASAEPELAELSAGEVADLRKEVEYLAGAVETYIEKAQPERMVDN